MLFSCTVRTPPVRAYSGTGCSPFYAPGVLYAPGVQPDNSDGTSWASLIGFRMKETGVGPGPGIPHQRSFTEVNVPLYSRESEVRTRSGFSEPGRKLAVRGWSWQLGRTAYPLCLVAHRLRAALGLDACCQLLSPEVRQGARSNSVLRRILARRQEDPLSTHLTASFGLHSTFRGRTVCIPNPHEPWLV